MTLYIWIHHIDIKIILFLTSMITLQQLQHFDFEIKKLDSGFMLNSIYHIK